MCSVFFSPKLQTQHVFKNLQIIFLFLSHERPLSDTGMFIMLKKDNKNNQMKQTKENKLVAWNLLLK